MARSFVFAFFFVVLFAGWVSANPPSTANPVPAAPPNPIGDVHDEVCGRPDKSLFVCLAKDRINRDLFIKIRFGDDRTEYLKADGDPKIGKPREENGWIIRPFTYTAFRVAATGRHTGRVEAYEFILEKHVRAKGPGWKRVGRLKRAGAPIGGPFAVSNAPS